MLPDITIEDLYKRDHRSVARNKLIVQIFYDIGYIEKYGSGTIKIIDLCRQGGLPSPEFKEVFSGFSVIFRKDIYAEEYLRKLGLNERQMTAIMYIKERGAISRKDYVALVKISPRMAHLDLADLVNKKVLVAIGKGRAVKYALHK